MKRCSLIVILCGIAVMIAPGYLEAGDIRDAVVKIFVTSNSMDFGQPWQSKGSDFATGSGCVIDGNRILTNAHVVTDQTFIQVRKHYDPKKYTARLLAIGHDCDLALLTVDDKAFFEGVTPVPFGDLPQSQDMVSVIGYPTGGDKLSITEGVVSRIEVRPYAHSNLNLLTVQIDAAINPGNSGGPVIQKGKLVGIAMQVAANTQNIGYIIPMPIIEHFFKDLNDSGYDGFPLLGIEFGGTENPALRQRYGIADKKGGVIVEYVMPFSSADGTLQAGDVILALDDIAIAEDGTFAFREAERLFLSHLITQKQLNDTMKIRLVRDGKEQTITVGLKPYTPLVPGPYFYEKPTYYIYGGFVFSVLSTDLLNSWGMQWGKGPFEFNEYRFGAERLNVDRRKEIVALLMVLPDELNVGYHNFQTEVIDTVNGKPIASFRDLVTTLNNSQEKYTIFETRQKSQIIIGTDGVQEAAERILQRYRIPAQYSDDVGEWLKEKE